MDNKSVIITVGIFASLGIVSYLAYTMIKAPKPVVPASKKQIATASKTVAQTKTALAKDPTNPALQAAYAAAANAFSQVLAKGLSSTKSGGSTTSPNGTAIVTVGKDGSYVEKGDPYTLYNKDGSIKGDLDASTGMFVSSNGTPIAAADGTPIKVNNDGTYTEPDGTVYNDDGTPINNNGDGTYTEPDGTRYTMDGNAIVDNGDGTYTEADGSVYANDGTPITDNGNGTYTESDGTVYNNDGSLYEGASGHRARKSLHSLLRR